MGYHIKIGEKTFCTTNPKIDWLDMLNALGHSGMCSHNSKESAEKQVAYLNEHGVPEAHVCEGFCDYVED